MRSRETGTFIDAAYPKVALSDGQRLPVAGMCGTFRGGEQVTFWVAVEYASRKYRQVAHSVEIAGEGKCPTMKLSLRRQ